METISSPTVTHPSFKKTFFLFIQICMLNKILRSVEDDCCSVILKDNSEDFLEIFQSVRLRRRLSESLPDDLRLHRRLKTS